MKFLLSWSNKPTKPTTTTTTATNQSTSHQASSNNHSHLHFNNNLNNNSINNNNNNYNNNNNNLNNNNNNNSLNNNQPKLKPILQNNPSSLITPASLNHEPLRSPTPLPPELTITILHPSELNPSSSIKSTIESRIASTGFKSIHQLSITLDSVQEINSLNLSPTSAAGLTVGENLIYLLSRSRAIQVWKELVGIELPGMPARPGSLKFILGTNSIWAADRPESVYELIRAFWPGSSHLQNNQFLQIHDNPKSFPFIHSSPNHPHLELHPIQPPRSPPRPRRVFKFSHPSRSAAGLATAVSRPTLIDKDRPNSLPSTQSIPTDQTPVLPFLSNNNNNLPPTPAISSSPLGSALLTPSRQSPPSPQPKTPTPNSSTFNETPTLIYPPQYRSPSTVPSPTNNSAEKSVSSSTSISPPDTSFLAKPTADLMKTETSTRAIKSNLHTPFRARPVPASHTEPLISPRMSKAAALRLGLTWAPPAPRCLGSSQTSDPPPSARTAPSTPSVASLNPPLVRPRETKASKLRTNGPSTEEKTENQPPPLKKKTEAEIFENTPGHGFRRANLVTKIPSIGPPKTEPRHTKASALRSGFLDLPASPPSYPPLIGSGSPVSLGSSTTKSNSRLSVDYFLGVPGHKRSEKIVVEATRKPTIEPRMTKASMLRMAGGAAPASKAATRRSMSDIKQDLARPHEPPGRAQLEAPVRALQELDEGLEEADDVDGLIHEPLALRHSDIPPVDRLSNDFGSVLIQPRSR